MPKGIYSGIKCLRKPKTKFIPTKHQLETLDFFTKPMNTSTGPFKGLLLYHKLGSGKTCTSLLISDKMLKENTVKHVYILTPGSLREGWINEYCNVCGNDSKILTTKYTFITYNYMVGNNLPDFTGSLLIIDEIHNLINGAKNMSKHATLIYNKIKDSDCRILALSGTPIYNYVFEWPLLGRLLKPGDFFPEIRIKDEIDSGTFMSEFDIDTEGVMIPRNKTTMKRKLDGIISYYPGAGKEFVPDIIYLRPIRALMSEPQEINYWTQFLQEEALNKPPKKDLLYKDKPLYELLKKLYIMAKKNILTRSASNFFYPGILKKLRDIPGPFLPLKKEGDTSTDSEAENLILSSAEETRGDELIVDGSIEEKIEPKKLPTKESLMNAKLSTIPGWVNRQYFSNGELYKMYSTKITALLLNILAHNLQKHVLFTFFKTKAGVYLIKSILGLCGVKAQIFSGDLVDYERRALLKKFNSVENRYGSLIKVLLVTEAGAEGISVLEARHMHILESSPRMSKTIQAIGRVARYKSHINLPPDERNIKVWRYWSTAREDPINITTSHYEPSGEKKEGLKVITNKTCIDEILYIKGMKIVRGIDSFLDLLKEVSVTKFSE